MDELKKLYQLRESLKDAEISAPKDLETKIARRESELIHSRMDEFRLAAERITQGIETPIKIVVNNWPSLKIDVIQTVVNDFMEKDSVIVKKKAQSEVTRKPATKLVVRFADGTVIQEPTSVDTFCFTILRLGIDNVEALKLTHRNKPLISVKKSKKRSISSMQRPLTDGKYLIVCASNVTRKELLETIADHLGIKLEVQLVPIKSTETAQEDSSTDFPNT